jgi:phage/plasmid-associated DNA primase
MDESIQFLVNSIEWATPFLNYLVHILKDGRGIRKLVAPQKVLEYTSEYRNENDGIAKFIAERIVPIDEMDQDENTRVDKNELKRMFKQWKDENDQRMLTVAELDKRIEAQFGKSPRAGWKNFKLDG